MRRLWIPTLFVLALSLLVPAGTIAAETRQPREGQKPAAGARADMMQQDGVTEEGKMYFMMRTMGGVHRSDAQHPGPRPEGEPSSPARGGER